MSAKEASVARYKALVGIDYPPNKRAEEGDIIEDLDGKAIKWLLDAGLIEPADGKPAEPKPAAKTAFKPDATDGDGDGLVQDGTPFERPVESEDN